MYKRKVKEEEEDEEDEDEIIYAGRKQATQAFSKLSRRRKE